MLLTIFPATVAKELNGYAETATKELTRILEGLLRPLLFSQEHCHTDVHGACSRKQLSFGFFGFFNFFLGGLGFFVGDGCMVVRDRGWEVFQLAIRTPIGGLSLWAFGAPRFTLVVLATWGLADSGGANILAR